MDPDRRVNLEDGQTPGASEGVEDNLDPWCRALHQQTLDAVQFLDTAIRAEIYGHVSKGKWG